MCAERQRCGSEMCICKVVKINQKDRLGGISQQLKQMKLHKGPAGIRQETEPMCLTKQP